ncbi:AI-2E family transporter [Siminovitchia sp. 179-K 8D1 HS]|uniref:AI-2E family transporter n=1 Tax=Siminovitchia sp. 179-K 8D1 HS TaxID=3142385 RepID=UPI0039A3DB09
MKESRIRLLYQFGMILIVFILLYFFLLIKPLWEPLLNVLWIGVLPFVIGGFIAYLLHPLVGRLELLGMNRSYAILFIYILFFGGIGYGLYLGIPALIGQMRHFSEHVPELLAYYKGLIRELDASTSRWPDGMKNELMAQVDSFELWIGKFMEKAISFVVGLVNYAIVLAVIPFISFYFLKDLERVKTAAWYMTPKKWRKNAVAFLSAVHVSLGGYIRGQLLVCSILGIISSLLFWVIGLDYPIILGLIIAFTNIIPYFGAVIGAVPVLAIALMSSIKQAVFALGIMVLLQFLEGNVLSPYIVGKSINIHPLFIIAALIIGGEAGGILGMLIAVPLLAVLKVAIIHTRDYLIYSR